MSSNGPCPNNMSFGGICPNDISPTMVYVQVIYFHWWYIKLLICMFIISETMFIKWWDNGKMIMS